MRTPIGQRQSSLRRPHLPPSSTFSFFACGRPSTFTVQHLTTAAELNSAPSLERLRAHTETYITYIYYSHPKEHASKLHLIQNITRAFKTLVGQRMIVMALAKATLLLTHVGRPCRLLDSHYPTSHHLATNISGKARLLRCFNSERPHTDY
jgi:hypothetical protein